LVPEPDVAWVPAAPGDAGDPDDLDDVDVDAGAAVATGEAAS
jgi:hypothetical protein